MSCICGVGDGTGRSGGLHLRGTHMTVMMGGVLNRYRRGKLDLRGTIGWRGIWLQHAVYSVIGR